MLFHITDTKELSLTGGSKRWQVRGLKVESPSMETRQQEHSLNDNTCVLSDGVTVLRTTHSNILST